MKKFKKPLMFALGILPIAMIATYFMLEYQLEILPGETVAELINQVGNKTTLILVGLVQTAIFVMVACFFGRMLSEKLGLWRPLKFNKKHFKKAFGMSIIAGILFSLDYWTFGSIYPEIQETTIVSLSKWGVLSGIFYGGIVEELLLRLFMMSLVAFVIWKLFYKKYNVVPEKTLIIANIVAALIFAAGHLPLTTQLFGSLTLMLVIRCFLLNGCFGIFFGYLYRKYGIGYAILAHSMCHAVSKLIWLVIL